VDIEIAGIVLQLNNNKTVTILSVYMAPSQNINIDHLNKMAIHNNILILGDFNGKNKLWGSPCNDSRGKVIETFLEFHDFVCLNKGDPTHINYNGTLSHLDLVISSKNLAFITDCELIDETWGSDHFPFEITINNFIPIFDKTLNNKYNIDKANWELYRSSVLKSNLYDEKIEDLESSYNKFKSLILEARDLAIPKRSNNFKHKYTPYWNKECSDAKKNKKNAMKILRKNNSVLNQTNYKEQKKTFKKIILKYKQMYWDNICEGINYKTKISEIWKKVKSLKGSNPNSKGIFFKPNGETEKDEDIANKFAHSFSLISRLDQNNEDTYTERNIIVNSFLNTYKLSNTYLNLSDATSEDSKLLNETLRRSELDHVLNSVNKKSSPGFDELSYQYLINLPEEGKNYYLKLINHSWELNIIPKSWKLAIVKPILKPNKDKKSYESYRPISLTLTTSKIMEKIIGNRLTWYLEKNNLLKPSQAGFRKKMSTSDALIRIEREANFAIHSGNYTVAILIDFTRAFDLLWVDGLLLKLIQLKIQGRIYNWIKNFLTDRKYVVKFGDTWSNPYTTVNGTPQGSSISPILFIIMINDFPLLSKFTSDAFFADDCSIWRSGTNLEQIFYHLQLDLNLISEWCRKWGFTINTTKTQGIIFTNKKILKIAY